MKKFSIAALAVLLTLSFAACGRKEQTPVTTTPTTETSVLPQMDPTMDTNIPDDNVNDNSTGNTDSTDGTDGMTMPGDTTEDTNARSRKMK